MDRVRSLGLCLALALSSLASAQTTGFPAERLRLTPDRSGLIDVEWGRVLPHLKWDVGLSFGFAKNPLVVYQLSDGARLGALVSDRVGGGLLFGVGLFGWVQLSLEAPFVLSQRGDTDFPGATVQPLPTLRAAGLGDARVVPKVRLLQSEVSFIDAAFQLGVTVPLSGGTQYLGDGVVTLTPELAVSKQLGGLRLAGNLALSVLRPSRSIANLELGNELHWRLGGGFRLRDHDASWVPLELDLTLSSATALAQPYANANQHALEARAQGSWHFANGLLPFLGLGVGLQPGWGTPDWRLYAGLRYTFVEQTAPPPPPPTPIVRTVTPSEPDADGDGIADAADACPREKGLKVLKGCPNVDADGDGVPDALDRCPTEPEDLDGFEDGDGCIDPDDDHDGVLDVKDRCRLEPEDPDQFEDDDGCPDSDNDGDGIIDGADKCPTEKGLAVLLGCPDRDGDGDGLVDRLDNCPAEAGPKENAGCAKRLRVVLADDELRLLESVFFQPSQAVLETRSLPLLDDVAAVLLAHPEFARVRIEGHTDSQGDDSTNLALSQARAEAVRDYLVMKKGVDSRRLEPRGFGETRPLTTNETVVGRAKNRRVEFHLVAPSTEPTRSE